MMRRVLFYFAIVVLVASGSNAAETIQPIEKAFISFRIGTTLWEPDGRYQELLNLFDKHKGATDEITFFPSRTHPPLPLETIKRYCEILKDRVAQAKARGYRSGINILSTLGHLDENLPNSLQGDYTHITFHDGRTAAGCYCPNDPRYRVYIRELYRLVTRAKPDYIWLDDDIRLMGHSKYHSVCYCDHCLAQFEKQTGKKYTRASLVEALNVGPADQQLAVRKAWLLNNRNTIVNLCKFIERTVHEIDPKMPLGMMTGERFPEGYDFDLWAEALAGPNHTPVYWRPGGGFYEDSSPGGLVGKSHQIGRQISLLQPWIRVIESEIENFPYQRLKKAAHITVVEAAAHIGAGCTGTAFNVLSMHDEPLDEYEPLVARIQRARPFYDLMARHIGRTPPAGVFPAWSKANALVPGVDWVGNAIGAGVHLDNASHLLEIGLPAAYAPQQAVVTLLLPQTVAVMSNEELTKVLSSGVYMDAETLNALNARGLQDLTGLAVKENLAIDCIEELTDHKLNGRFAGRQRDTRQSFYSGPGFALAKTDPKAETLAGLIDYGNKEKATASMAVFENRLGGRVCVCSYTPWASLHTLSKTEQMKSVVRWLSRDRLPAYVSSYHKVNLWARQPDKDRMSIALLNASFDPAEKLELALLTSSDTIKVYDMDGHEQTVQAAGADGPYRRFTLPAVEPWTMRLVVTCGAKP
jgi:hypothetical protein